MTRALRALETAEPVHFGPAEETLKIVDTDTGRYRYEQGYDQLHAHFLEGIDANKIICQTQEEKEDGTGAAISEPFDMDRWE